MATLRQIAKDPRKALADLEKELGVRPGDLVREMDHFAQETGDWTEHIPYGLAAEYYDSPKAQAQFQSHVDGCGYCQRLLETVHPSDVQAEDFAKAAVRAQPNRKHALGSSWTTKFAVASVLVLAIAAIAAPRFVRKREVIAQVLNERPTLAQELRTQPTTLVRLEKSDNPVERYEAARVYFAADKPELAWQQIGQGLQLAGLTPGTAQRITSAANVPSEESAATLAGAAQRLHALQTKLDAARQGRKDPSIYLERAEVEAKLGLNADALKSIQQYLEATNVDPKILADFSKTALAKSPKLLAGTTEPTQ